MLVLLKLLIIYLLTGSTSSVAAVPVVSVHIHSPLESPSSEAISSKEDFVEEEDWGRTYPDLSSIKIKKVEDTTPRKERN